MQRQKPRGPGKPGPRFKSGKGFKPQPSKGNQNNKNNQKRPRDEFKKSKLAATDTEIQDLKAKYTEIDAQAIKKFRDFPLSHKTQKALAEFKFINPTLVQRESIGPALMGKDVLGAAVTGSGKTLAFLIPVSIMDPVTPKNPFNLLSFCRYWNIFTSTNGRERMVWLPSSYHPPGSWPIRYSRPSRRWASITISPLA